MTVHYLYIGTSKDLKDGSVVKMGTTTKPVERLDTYDTAYPAYPFKYEHLIVLNNIDGKIVEGLCSEGLKNTRDNGGRSGIEWFYRKDMNINHIKETLEKYRIDYKILSKEDIGNLIRQKRKNIRNEAKSKRKEMLEKINKFKNGRIAIRPYQIEARAELIKHYKSNDKATINWACGIGKTLLSLITALELKSKKILIGVPNKNLKSQWINAIKKLFNKHNIVHKNYENKEQYNDAFIIVTTYHNSKKFLNLDITVDFKIADEAHHLCGIRDDKAESKNFVKFLAIKTDKSLFLTATRKITDDEGDLHSMDDEDIFGPVIDEKSVYWAINEKLLTEYSLIDIANTAEDILQIMEKIGITTAYDDLKEQDKSVNLFLSAYIALKEINETSNNLNKLLIYANTIESAMRIRDYCNDIIKTDIFTNLDGIYINCLNNNTKYIDTEIKKFKDNILAIITCVQIFGEGYDEPSLDGVVFAEGRNSVINITQSCLRPHRINPDKPDKHACIILPRVDYDECEEEHLEDQFDKIERIIRHLRNVDENIDSRIISRSITSNRKKKISVDDNPEYTEIDNTENLKNILTRRKDVKRLTVSEFSRILQKFKITKKTEYDTWRKSEDGYDHFPVDAFKDIEGLFGNDFCWMMAIPETIRLLKYHNRSDCIESVKNIYDKYCDEIDELYEDDKLEFVCKIDSKIPNYMLLNEFYGGEKKDFRIYS